MVIGFETGKARGASSPISLAGVSGIWFGGKPRLKENCSGLILVLRFSFS